MRVSMRNFFNKIFGGFPEYDRFLKKILSISLEKFTHSFQSFTRGSPPLIASWFGDG